MKKPFSTREQYLTPCPLHKIFNHNPQPGGQSYYISYSVLSTLFISLLIFLGNNKLNAQCILDGDWSITQPSCPFSSNGQICCDTLYGNTPGTGIGPYTCSISSSDESFVNTCFENLAVGTYTVTTTSADGCIGIFHNLELTSPYSSIEISATEIPATCGSANGTVCCSVTGGSGSFTYLWIRFSDFAILGNETCLSNLDPNESYSFTAYDENSPCFAIAEITVGEENFTTEVETSISNCVNPTCNGTASITPMGTSPYFIEWEEGALANNEFNNSTFELEELCPGNYTATITDANGCSSAIDFTIQSNQSTPEVLIESNLPICEVNNGEICVSIEADQENYLYQWNNLSSNSSLTDEACLSDAQPGEYQVVITEISSGCQWQFNHTLMNTALVIDSDVISSSCIEPNCNGSVTFNLPLALPYSIQWTDNMFPAQLFESNQMSVNDLCPGSYTGIISTGENCAANFSFMVGLEELSENEVPCQTIDVIENSFSEVIIWPNPFNENLEVAFAKKAILLEFLDITGRSIFITNTLHTQNRLNLENLAPANYIIRAVMDDGTSVIKKIVKQ